MKTLRNQLIKERQEVLVRLSGMPMCIRKYFINRALELKKQIQEAS